MFDKWSLRKKRGVAIGALGALLALCVVGFLCVGDDLIAFLKEVDLVRSWVDQNPVGSRSGLFGLVLLKTLIPFLPGEPIEIAVGYAFGVVEGTLLCLLGSFLGSVVVFQLVRRFGVKVVELFFSREKILSLRFLRNERRLAVVLFFLFMIPGTPKDLLSYVAGLTNLKFSSWLLIASVGRIPSVITSTIGGDALGSQQYLVAIVVFAVTIVLSGLGLLYYHRRFGNTDEI